MSTPPTTLSAALARIAELEADMQAASLALQIAQKRLSENAQSGGPRYARNVPEVPAGGWPRNEHKKGYE